MVEYYIKGAGSRWQIVTSNIYERDFILRKNGLWLPRYGFSCKYEAKWEKLSTYKSPREAISTLKKYEDVVKASEKQKKYFRHNYCERCGERLFVSRDADKKRIRTSYYIFNVRSQIIMFLYDKGILKYK